MIESRGRWLAPCCCAALAASCSFTTFDDYEAKAPAVKIEQEGGRHSAAFGVHLAPMPRRQVGKLLTGAALLVSGNSPVALNTVTFGVDGKFANSEAEGEDFLKFLDEPDQITALAAAPSEDPPDNHGGPFAYLGQARKGVGSLRIVDINSYDGPAELSAPAGVTEFARAVAAVDLGGTGARREDLAIGARGALVLWRNAGWPHFSAPEQALVIGSGGTRPTTIAKRWPANSPFTALASAQLAGGRGEAIAAGAPGENYAALLHDLGQAGSEGCVDVCVQVLEPELPGGANAFGAAVLLADVSGDEQLELVVGAPDGAGGAVYVYELGAAQLAGTSALGEPRKIAAPAGAAGFGAGLAFGRFDGERALLAVGAPGAEVDGQAKAGAIYLFERGALDAPTGTVRLARPAAKGQLGGALGLLPFKSDERVHDVLVASGATAAYVFFASLTPQHKDVRAR